MYSYNICSCAELPLLTEEKAGKVGRAFLPIIQEPGTRLKITLGKYIALISVYNETASNYYRSAEMWI